MGLSSEQKIELLEDMVELLLTHAIDHAGDERAFWEDHSEEGRDLIRRWAQHRHPEFFPNAV